MPLSTERRIRYALFIAIYLLRERLIDGVTALKHALIP